MKQALLAAIIGTSTLLVSGTAAAQAKPEEIIKFRQSVYTVIGWHVRPLGGMVKGQIPFNQAEFLRNADIVADMSKIAPLPSRRARIPAPPRAPSRRSGRTPRASKR